MANSPMVDLGTLNRLLTSLSWNNFPALNVTAPFLGRGGIQLAFEGNATQFLPVMTGAVTSPEPYQMTSLTINLLKSQGLSQQYELQKRLNSLLGNGVLRTDSASLGPFDILNCGIMTVSPLAFSGEDAGYTVSVQGYMLINSQLWP
jgi:hypothetical protein